MSQPAIDPVMAVHVLREHADDAVFVARSFLEESRRMQNSIVNWYLNRNPSTADVDAFVEAAERIAQEVN